MMTNPNKILDCFDFKKFLVSIVLDLNTAIGTVITVIVTYIIRTKVEIV